jgi:multiple sugar transport system ATP-binding protein
LKGGVFEGLSTKVTGLSTKFSGKASLGIRPEDVSVSTSAKASVKSKIYSLEPTGDQTLLTVKLGDQLLVARADRDFRDAIDANVNLAFDTKRVYLFDGATGARIRT